MRFDENLMFSAAQTLSGASADSTNIVDLGTAGIAEGPAYVVATVGTKSVSNLAVSLQTSDDNSTYKEVASRAAATGDVGDTIVLAIPPGCGRYLKLVYTGTSMTGTISAGITLAAQSPKGLEQYAAN